VVLHPLKIGNLSRRRNKNGHRGDSFVPGRQRSRVLLSAKP
jgi:hypothetical protein